MSREFRTVAWLGPKQVPVTVVYEADGNNPLVYGVFHGDEDVTCDLAQPEYDLIYQKVGTHILESMTDAAEIAAEGER